jgi:hypothetical protein
MKLKWACLTWLLLYAAIAASLGLFVYRRVPQPGPAWAAGLIGGFFVWLGIAYLIGIRQKIAEALLVGRAMKGTPPQDGKKIAAIGRIQSAGGRTMLSPFTKTPCLAYAYEIHKSDAENSHYRVYSGFALVPSAIQSGSSSVKLLAYPDLQTPKTHPAGLETVANATEYVGATTFQHLSGTSVREAFKRWMDQFKDDDGSIRVDERVPPADVDLSDAFFMEQVVRPGDEVCAIGLYSAQRGALVPDPDAQLHPAILRQGDPAKVRAAGFRSAIGYLIGGLFLLTATAAALAFFLIKVPLDASESMSENLDPSWAEVRLERLIERRGRVPLREAGMLGTEEVLVSLPNVEARGRFRVGTEEHRVREARAVRVGDDTEISFDADKAVLIIGPDRAPKRLRLLDREVDPATFAEALQVQLHGSLDEDGEISGRITYVSEYQPDTICRIRFRARFERAAAAVSEP